MFWNFLQFFLTDTDVRNILQLVLFSYLRNKYDNQFWFILLKFFRLENNISYLHVVLHKIAA